MPTSNTLAQQRDTISTKLRSKTRRCILASAVTCAALTLASAAFAQDIPAGGSALSPTLRLLGGFASVGGYYFTGAGVTRAVGTPKFASDSQFFGHPKRLGGFALSGGLEIISANDHFLPFQGGNEFDMIGPAFKLSTPRVVGKVRPVVTGGLFLGRLRSVSEGFDRSNFSPSISLGVEYPVTRYLTLYTNYRVNQEIHSISTNGVSVGVKVF